MLNARSEIEGPVWIDMNTGFLSLSLSLTELVFSRNRVQNCLWCGLKVADFATWLSQKQDAFSTYAVGGPTYESLLSWPLSLALLITSSTWVWNQTFNSLYYNSTLIMKLTKHLIPPLILMFLNSINRQFKYILSPSRGYFFVLAEILKSTFPRLMRDVYVFPNCFQRVRKVKASNICSEYW